MSRAADDLTGRVRALADELGVLPSKRRVMTEFRVGAPRAAAALDAVRDTMPAPADVPAEPTVRARPARAPRASATAPALTSAATVSAPATRPPDAPADAPDAPVETLSGPRTTAPETPGVTALSSQLRTAADAPADALESAVLPVVDQVPDTSGRVPPSDAPGALPDAPADAPDAHRARAHELPRWPLWLIAAGAFVAVWSGWVGLGEMTGFGEVTLLPGIADEWVINSAIVLPIGVEAYAGYALRAWLAGPDAGLSRQAQAFAKWSALAALVLGAAGQVAYHVMKAAGVTEAPWQITAAVSCLPVIVLGCAAALAHLAHPATTTEETPR